MARSVRAARLSALALACVLASACGGAEGPRTEVATSGPLAVGACAGFEGRALATTVVSLLAGHLTMKPLEGLEVVARPRPVMAAPDPDAWETRLALSDGEDRKLVVIVNEPFRRPGSDLAQSVSAWLESEEEEADVTAIDVAAPLRAVLAVPRRVDASGEAVLVARVVVASPDDTAQHLGLFVSSSAIASGHEGCGELAARMARTLAPGARRVEASGGRAELTRGLTLEVAQGWVVLSQPGRDFDVAWISHLVPLGGPHSGLGVYLGAHPNPHSNEAIDLREEPGTLFGRAVMWRAWTTPGHAGRDQHREVITAVPGDESRKAHVFMVTEDPAAIAEMTRMAESLAVAAATVPAPAASATPTSASTGSER